MGASRPDSGSSQPRLGAGACACDGQRCGLAALCSLPNKRTTQAAGSKSLEPRGQSAGPRGALVSRLRVRTAEQRPRSLNFLSIEGVNLTYEG